MNIYKATKNTVLAAALALLAATSAQASITIGYSTSGATVSSGLGNDTITLNPFNNGSVTLTANSFSVFGELSSVTWDAVNSTPGIDMAPVSQNLTVALPVGSQTLIISQTITLAPGIPIPFGHGDQFQTLFIGPGTTVNFTWDSGGSAFDLAVTPLGAIFGPLISTGNGVRDRGEIFANFDLTSTRLPPAPDPIPTAVPEPSTCIAGALLLLPLGLSALRVFNKKRLA